MTDCHDSTTEQERLAEAVPADAAPAEPTVSEDAGRHQLEDAVANWRNELGDQVSVPSSLVQDHLLDLWGLLPEGDTRSQVETWLSETLQRHLYEVADIERRLDTVLA